MEITVQLNIEEGDFFRFDNGGTVELRAVGGDEYSEAHVLLKGDYPIPDKIDGYRVAEDEEEDDEEHYWMARIPAEDFKDMFFNATAYTRKPKF